MKPPFNPSQLYKRLVGSGYAPAQAKATVDEHIRRAELGLASDVADKPGVLASTLSGFGQGASFGLSDELAGILDPSVAQALGTGDIRQIHAAISAATKQNRDYLAAARAANPRATNYADLAGTVLSSGLATAAAAPVVAGLTPAATGALTGGTIGALEGAARSEGSLKERVPGAVAGGVVGAGTGYVGGKIVGAVGPTVKQINKNLRRLARNLRGPTIPPSPPSPPPPSPPPPMSPAAMARFQQAFGVRPPNAPVISPSIAPSTSVPMNLQTPGYAAVQQQGLLGAPAPSSGLLGPSPTTALMPQDYYAETPDLQSLLKGPGIDEEYGALIKAELARRRGLLQ